MAMKTLLRLVALSIAAFAQPVLAQDSAPAPAPAAPSQQVAAQPAKAAPALWKVADEDTTIYLFGTIHVLPEGIDWFNGNVATAFAESDTLVTEIVEADDATMQSLVIGKAMLPPDQSLRGLLPKADRAAYEAVLGRYNIPPVVFDRFEPWYAAVALSTLPLMKEGFATENGVETRLDARARARQMPHEGLETPAYQLGLFDGLPMDVQKSYLSEVVEQLPVIKDKLTAMVEAWRTGNAAELASLMNIEQSNPVLVKTLLVDRNKNWAAWIGSRLARPGTVFLAVGAGHLGGPGSVQDQLAVQNIAIERLQ